MNDINKDLVHIQIIMFMCHIYKYKLDERCSKKKKNLFQ